MNRSFFYIVLCCFPAFTVQAQQPAPPAIGIRWSFVKNLYGTTPKAISALSIINKGSRPFPASGWKIYFNGNRSIDTASMEGNLLVRHVNGDLFYLMPAEDAHNGARKTKPMHTKELPSGDSMQVQYTAADLSINVSDAPIGFYLVWDRQPAIGYPVRDYIVGRVDDEKLALMTPEKEFARNAGIKDIPAAKLPRIFPTPLFYQEKENTFPLTTDVPILTDPAFKEEAGYLAATLSPILGRRPTVHMKREGTVLPVKRPSIWIKKISSWTEDTAALDSSAYELRINGDSVVICAYSTAGAFYGIQSLLTAIDPAAWKGRDKAAGLKIPRRSDPATSHLPADPAPIHLPGMEVKDKPRFAFRGFMLDVARNFRSPRELYRVLDLMALYKMNVLHLHFSDDEGWRLEIPSLPELTDIGGKRGHGVAGSPFLPASFGSGPAPGRYPGSGYYTRTDFINILRYARVRHIQVIPEIESPGHTRAAIQAMDLRYEKYKKLGNYTEAVRYLLRDTLDRSIYEGAQLWHDNVLCVALPSVYRFMDTVIENIRKMYRTAGATLTTIHLGGDEVPAGVWEGSPACRMLMDTGSADHLRANCWAYYYNKMGELLAGKGLALSGWEEINTPGNKNFQVYVWDNMIGGGNEDLPYRLANTGYPVVLSCVSNNYYDLAYNRYFEEKGYHWGGFQDMDRPFSFIPYDYYRNSQVDYTGNPVAAGYFNGKERLSEKGRKNILGIEGLLWAENLPTDERMEYMLLPKLLGTAERAWASDPSWAMAAGDTMTAGSTTTYDSTRAAREYNDAWSLFVNVLGKRELPRLNYWNGGYAYRVPVAGVKQTGDRLTMNCVLPGFVIRYTTDGSEPQSTSPEYREPIKVSGTIRIRVFDPAGRGGRTVTAGERSYNQNK